MREYNRQYDNYDNRANRANRATTQRQQPRYAARPTYATSYDDTDEPAVTLGAKIKRIAPTLRKLNTYIIRAFPDSADEIAQRLVAITPRAIALCYVLLIAGVVASRLSLLWSVGYLWGIASLGSVMIGVFFWVWSSNVLRLPDLSAEARAALKRAMQIQSSTFVAAVFTIIYFIGMAFGQW